MLRIVGIVPPMYRREFHDWYCNTLLAIHVVQNRRTYTEKSNEAIFYHPRLCLATQTALLKNSKAPPCSLLPYKCNWGQWSIPLFSRDHGTRGQRAWWVAIIERARGPGVLGQSAEVCSRIATHKSYHGQREVLNPRVDRTRWKGPKRHWVILSCCDDEVWVDTRELRVWFWYKRSDTCTVCRIGIKEYGNIAWCYGWALCRWHCWCYWSNGFINLDFSTNKQHCIVTGSIAGCLTTTIV